MPAYGTHPDQHVDVYVPAGGSRGAVALIHGGFRREQWDKTQMEPLARDLVARGLEAWNLEFRRTGSGGGVPETLEDVEVALALAGPHVVAVGHAAGGHLALWAAGRGLVRAAVSLAGGRSDDAEQVQLLPIEVPVLLVHDRDDTVPVEQSRVFARVSGAELLELPGVGQLEPIDPAHESWALVVDWIESLS